MPKGSKKRRAERRKKMESELQSSSTGNTIATGEIKEEVNHSKIPNGSSNMKEPSMVQKKASFVLESSDKIEPTMVHEAAPYVIVVHGPPKVGKSLLITSLVEHYGNEKHALIQGPITIALANRRRIQFVECPNNMNGMIDAAKYADVVMLLIDANYGFEMETFEFLSLLDVHGMANVVGVLTYLDELKDESTRRITKQRLMQKLRTKIYEGTHIFCLSGLLDGMYLDNEIQELADFLRFGEFLTSQNRPPHPYLLVDRFEDNTSGEEELMDSNCRRISLYGYLRGFDIKRETKVHIAGVGDFSLADVAISADPCPLPPSDSSETKSYIEPHNPDQEPQLENESFRIGTYLKLEVFGVPYEVTNSDPCQPILVAGLSPAEQIDGYMQVKLKRHSWHMNSLKTGSPVIVSVGWRRYQTMPFYTRDHNGRHKVLEYTPEEDEECDATFWGPLAPSGVRVVAVRSLANKKAAFRILATAVVLDHRAVKMSKKIKRTGTACSVLKETAFIEGLFTSDDEVALFKNAKVKTDGEIRGAVSEAAESDFIKLNGQSKEGIAKCTFDRTINVGDIIVLSHWIKIEVPRISHPPTAALETSNCVWDIINSVEKTQMELNGNLDCKAHILVIENDNDKIVAECHRKWLTDLVGEKLKDGPAHTRGMPEQRRAVIFSVPKPFGWDSELRQKGLIKLRKNMFDKVGPGMISTKVIRRDGEVSTGIAGG